MTTKYWIRNGSQVEGPFDQLQVRGLVAIGRLSPTTDISVDGLQWRNAAKVKGLFPEKPSVEPTDVFATFTTPMPAKGAGEPAKNSSPPTTPSVQFERAKMGPKTRFAVSTAGVFAAGIGAYVALHRGGAASISECSDPAAIKLATSIIYENLAKRTNVSEVAAALGTPMSKADAAAVELKVRRYVTFDLTGISTVGTAKKKVQCKASLMMKVEPGVDEAGQSLSYFLQSYHDGDEVSYSVRETDDGQNIYVRIPAE